jgi:hypothetical protein
MLSNNSLQLIKVHQDEPEHIVLQVNRNCDLSNYAVFNMTYPIDAGPKVKQSYFFQKELVKTGDYVFLHTGNGVVKKSANPKKPGNYFYMFYWEQNKNVWIDEGDCCSVVQYKLESRSQVV